MVSETTSVEGEAAYEESQSDSAVESGPIKAAALQGPGSLALFLCPSLAGPSPGLPFTQPIRDDLWPHF